MYIYFNHRAIKSLFWGPLQTFWIDNDDWKSYLQCKCNLIDNQIYLPSFSSDFPSGYITDTIAVDFHGWKWKACIFGSTSPFHMTKNKIKILVKFITIFTCKTAICLR